MPTPVRKGLRQFSAGLPQTLRVLLDNIAERAPGLF
ncbi:hypothetical protein LPU83_pLPU83c_0447 (plasmid) [Rhizobium favelukesii]|uniref:Uncharacterized protein n=1 Tax=Rhizobium favelukesii TaxID=348824 RepID=W6RJK5_9HYPH|nr:hypothetical protein LPU83_pLPU83c_0447 [Rhizobium favelukesii]